MRRPPNPNSPEEVRRAIQLLNQGEDEAASGLAAFIVLVAETYVPYVNAHSSVDLDDQNITSTGNASFANCTLTGYMDGYADVAADGEILYWDTGNARFDVGDHGDIAGLGDNDHPQYSHLKTGWAPGTAADEAYTLAIDTPSRTFSLTHSGTGEYWIAGVRETFAAPLSVVFDDTEGMWHISITSGGTMEASQTDWNFDDTAVFVSEFYWDAVNGAVVGMSSELHSWILSDPLHEYLHESFGTRWANGLGVAINGDELDVGIGRIFDEDIECNITDDLGSGRWDQTLTPLTCPILYRDGAAGNWRVDAASSVPVILTANVPQVNYATGGVWDLEDVGVNRYFVYWIIASTNQNYPVYLVPGQEDGATLNATRDGNSIADMEFGNLPVEESKVIARVIVQRQAGSPYYSLIEVNDYRNVVDEPGVGAVVGDHGNLVGLNDDDHAQYHNDARAATWLAANHETTYNHANYDTAYGWGDHAGLYVPIANDGKVKVDVGATGDYLGAAFNDGALRTSTGISFADGGNFVTLTTNDGEIVHNSLSGYDSNDHVDHTTVTFSAGSGLTGGGTLAANRTFDLDINGLDADTIVAADTIAFYDATGTHNNKTAFSDFNAALDHGAFLGLGDDDHTSYHTDGRAATWLAANHETTYDHSLIGPAILDDVTFDIGTSVDYWFLYNSSGTAYEFWSTNVNGGGADGLVMAVQDGTDDVDFTGDIAASAGTFSGLITGTAGADITATTNQEATPGVTSTSVATVIQAGTSSGSDETYDNLWEAMKFTASGNHALRSFRVQLKKTGTITNLSSLMTGYLYTDVAGKPGAQIGSLGTVVAYGSIGTGYTVLYFGVSSGVTLSSGSDYWIVLKQSIPPDGGTVFIRRSSSGTATWAYSADGSSWTTENSKTGRFDLLGMDAQPIYGISLSSIAVFGESTTASGVRGESISDNGVYGFSKNSSGVYGTSTRGHGVNGVSTDKYGVRGESSNDAGVRGLGGGFGVYGSSPGGIAMYGVSTNSYSGFFTRNTATPSNPVEVVRIKQDHASDTNHALVIQQDGSGSILRLYDGAVLVADFKDGGDVDVTGVITCDGLGSVNTGAGTGASGTSDSGKGLHGISTSGTAIHGASTSGWGIYGESTSSWCGYFYRNVSDPTVNDEVVRIHQAHAGCSKDAARIYQTGTGSILQLYDGAALVADFKDAGDVDLVGDVEITGDLDVTGTITGIVAGGNPGDDVAFEFGDEPDYWFVYNSGGTIFEFWTSDSDGGGADAVVWSVDDGTKETNFFGDVDVTGVFTCDGLGSVNTGAGTGASGTSDAGKGLYGISTSGDAVYGHSISGRGIYGESHESFCGYFYRNISDPSVDDEVVRIHQAYAGCSKDAARIYQTGTGSILQLFDGASLEVDFKDGGDVDFTSIVKAGGYKSSDGTAGATSEYALDGGGTLSVKNGLVTGYA